MRSKNAAFLALLAGDQLDLVALIEIATSKDPLRYALDTEARIAMQKTVGAIHKDVEALRQLGLM